MKRTDVFKVKYTELEVADGFNIRYDYGDIEALAISIKENGVKNPLRGYKKDDKFVITDGHRRYKAIGRALELGADPEMDITVMPDSRDVTEVGRVLGMVIYNDGKRLTLLEEAMVYGRLVESGMTQAEIATKVGKTPTHISNLMLLLKAPESLKTKIISNKISASLVIEELKRKSPEELNSEVEEAVEKNEGKKVSNKDLKTPHEKAKEFLVGKGLMSEDAKDFIINFESDDEKSFDLIELMVEFKRKK